jgi:hypothetical protein
MSITKDLQYDKILKAIYINSNDNFYMQKALTDPRDCFA